MRHDLTGTRLWAMLIPVALAMPATLLAKEAAHVHGLVRLDVAVDGKTLTLQLEAPLDSVLGFEHRPRTTAQRQAGDALLRRMEDAASLFRPEAAAMCTPTRTRVDSQALQSKALQSRNAAADKEDEHADIEVSIEFSCLHPDQLTSVEVGLFDAFKRIQRIEVQVVGAKGQSKQTLNRPQKLLKLRR